MSKTLDQLQYSYPHQKQKSRGEEHQNHFIRHWKLNNSSQLHIGFTYSGHKIWQGGTYHFQIIFLHVQKHDRLRLQQTCDLFSVTQAKNAMYKIHDKRSVTWVITTAARATSTYKCEVQWYQRQMLALHFEDFLTSSRSPSVTTMVKIFSKWSSWDAGIQRNLDVSWTANREQCALRYFKAVKNGNEI